MSIVVKQTDYLHAYRYFAQALDPIHIGTGGERLSRVDMAIVREAGTGLPKLPGTSLSGACRAYVALQDKRPGCAGQGQPKLDQHGTITHQGHCGDCRNCRTFGFTRNGGVNASSGKKGAAQFSDAPIAAFPVAGTNGPLWLTCADALARIDLSGVTDAATGTIQLDNVTANIIAVGWLALQRVPASQDFSAMLRNIVGSAAPARLALVPNALFATIINDNLEVRTSVAIDPVTGAAEDGALFTYEAIPTGTLFALDVLYQGGETETVSEARATVEDGLALFAWMGIGGMNTRGMGRLRVLGVQ